ncbi:MAG: CinA family protein [Vulcanimicrobiota bacterium]
MDELVAQLSQRLASHGWRVAVAESCTGGLVSATLTEQPGCSAWFVGGVVAYENEVKCRVLGLDEAHLRKTGAVAPETALAMAQGACERLGAEVGLGLTGIAGPGGATFTKPVGLVYVALVWPGGQKAESHQFGGSRSEVRRQACQAALELALTAL